jgi:S-formylglutathione hydrolase FrmB
MYLLHGLSDDHTIWLRRTSIERYAEEIGIAVVMPDGGRSFYCDAASGPAFAVAIAEELPSTMEACFALRSDRGGRAVAGLSMGGYGAIGLALKYPERYCAASSHSGALHFGNEPATGLEQYPVEFEQITGKDVPGGPCDLFSLVERADRSGLPKLRLDCGTEDHLLDVNRRFHEHLTRLGIDHEYREYPGAHEWPYWDEHVRETLSFVRDAIVR